MNDWRHLMMREADILAWLALLYLCLWLGGIHSGSGPPCFLAPRARLHLERRSAAQSAEYLSLVWFAREGQSWPNPWLRGTTEWPLEGTKLAETWRSSWSLRPNDSARAYAYGEFALRFYVPIDSSCKWIWRFTTRERSPIYKEALHAYSAVV
jgi:hypothetical protein